MGRGHLCVALVAWLLILCVASASGRNSMELATRKVIDPYTGKIVDYNMIRRAGKPVAWGDEPRSGEISFAPSTPRETPRIGLGSTTAPAGVASPGLTIYSTYMDDQYNAVARRMVDFRGSRPDIHFAYSSATGVLEDSRIGYNVYDPVGGMWPRGFQVGCLIQNPGDSGLQPSVDVNGKGRIVIGEVDNSGSASLENHLYYQPLTFSCSFGAGTAITQVQYNSYFMNTSPSNNLYEPSVEIQQWGSDTITHVLAREELPTTSVGGFSRYTINYFRKVGAGTAGTWTGPKCIDTLNVISTNAGPHNGSITASRVSANIAVAYPHWKISSSLSDELKRYDNDIFYRVSVDAGLTWGPPTNLTNYSRIVPSFTAFLGTQCLYDHQDFLHVLWTAGPTPANVYSDPAFFWGDFSTNIWHWSNRTGQIAKVHNADWGIDVNSRVCGFGSPGTGYVGFYSLAECEGRIYVVFDQFLNYFGNDASPTTPQNIDDCAAGGFTDRRYAANGELYMVVSTDLDGISWDAARNITRSYTPRCDSAGGLGGLCMNDNRATLSRYGMATNSYDTGAAHIPVTLIWPGPEKIDLTPPGDPPDTGGNYIMMMYTEDHFPGPGYRDRSFTHTYGPTTLNPLRWVRLACANPVLAPQIFTDTTRIGYPAFTHHGVQKTVTVTVRNEGNATLNISQIGTVKSTRIANDWLGVSTSTLSVPAGLSNTATLDITLNKGGAINSPGTVVDLSGYVYLKSNALSPRDSINIVIDRFLVADTVVGQAWDTISTPCGVRLIVSNNGDMGRQGIGRVNMDFAALGGDCDSLGANVYLNDGGPVVVREITPGSQYSWTSQLYQGTFATAESFRPVAGGTSGSFVGAGFDGFRTGTFVNCDSLIGVRTTYWAPTGGGDSCNFIIVQRKLFPYKGIPVSKVTIGEQVDWDIPSDIPARNSSGLLLSSSTVYQRGTDTGMVPDCGAQNDSARYGAGMLLGMYSNSEFLGNSCVNNSSPYGVFSESQDTLVKYDTLTDGNLEGKYFWNRMLNQTGLTSTPGKTDLRTISTYYANRNFTSALDTVTIYTAVASVKKGTASDLDSTFARAKKWYGDHLRPGCNFGGCCVANSIDGRTGNIDGDPDKIVDISDLSRLVDYLYVNFTPLCCFAAGNIDGDQADGIDISDLSALLDHLFVSFSPTALCRPGGGSPCPQLQGGNTFVRQGTVTPTTGPNSIRAGATVSIPIVYGNRDAVSYGVSNGFIIYSDADGIPGDGTPGSRGTGTATWAHANGNGGNVKMTGAAATMPGIWVDTVGFIHPNMYDLVYKFNMWGADGSGVDTVMFSGVIGPATYPGMPVKDSGVFFNLKILTKLSDTGKFICIDSSSQYPPTGTWKWPVIYSTPAYNSIPTWSGARCFQLTACPSCDGASSSGQATLTDSSGNIVVGNIGSSGNDGVAIAFPDVAPLSGLSLDFGRLNIDAIGKEVSFTPHLLGAVAKARDGLFAKPQSPESLFTVSIVGSSSNNIVVGADFSTIGDPTPLLQVYSAGVLKGSRSVPGGTQIAFGAPVGGGSLALTNVAMDAGNTVPPTFSFTLNRATSFSTSGGALAVGDEMRLIADDVPAGSYTVNSFNISAKNTGSFLISKIDPTPGCQCIGMTGNIDCDPENRVDISDLTTLVDNLYINFTALCCPPEANVDGSTDGKADISDISMLVNYLYVTFVPVQQCP